jgi:predicted DNA-binding protein with PD1-like motif
VQGGITISLKQDKLEAPQKITMVSGEKSPFPFHLFIELSEKEGKTEGCIVFDGEVNAFLKMMVKKPLTNLFDYMSNSLKNKYA